MIGKIRQAVSLSMQEAAAARVYEKYKSFTMIPKRIYVANLVVVQDMKKVPGCVVECGVWRGGMSAGMADVLGPDRSYYLFDSFEGLPPAKEIDGARAIAWQANKDSPDYLNNCATEKSFAEEAMKQSRAKKVEIIKGWFDATLPDYKFDSPIAVLRVDADWYDSVMTCLQHLMPKMAPGGLVILDDYAVWEGCSKATHQYLADHPSAARIVQMFGSVYAIHNVVL